MAQTSFALLTNTGRAKEAAALAAATTIQITQIAIGSGTTVPSGGETSLYNEVARKTIYSSGVVAGATNVAYFDAYLTAEEGPYTITEAGLYDSAGDLIAIAYYSPAINKPVPSSGQTVEGIVRLEVAFSNASSIAVTVDSTLKVPLQRLTRLPWVPVISITTTTPPTSPSVGDTYIVPSGATGAWASQTGKLAEYTSAGWALSTPPNGHGISLPDGSVYERISSSYVKRGQVESAITKSGLTYSFSNQDQLATAIRSQAMNYRTAGGTANALTVTLDPAPASYGDVKVLWIVPSAANTAGAVTIQANSLAAVSVKVAGDNPAAGALKAGIPAMLVWTGTDYALAGAQTTGQLINTQTYTASGSYTPSAGTKRIVVTVQGGGGAGGGSLATASTSNYGGAAGGGAGETRFSALAVSALTVPVAVTVGAGGAGVIGANGANGGSSSFGSYVTASGGTGGARGAEVSTAYVMNGGSGGRSGSGGSRAVAGADGVPSVNFNNGNFVSGSGGYSYFGAGGAALSTTSGSGQSSPSYGAGGGGSAVQNGAGPATGGNGGVGVVIIEEYA